MSGNTTVGPRYRLHPGFVISVNDRQRHWITGPRLAELYRLAPGTYRMGLPRCGR